MSGKKRECDHPTLDDHSRLLNSKRVWTCTACGREAPWQEHEYHGSLECKRCQRAVIEAVFCRQPDCVQRGKR